MNEDLSKILKRLEDFSDFNKKQRKTVRNDLIDFASENTEIFIDSIRNLKPCFESVLFEVYETLATQPDKWVDFIILEFDRIQKISESSAKKLKESVSNPLIAISFFARIEFSGNEKLVRRIKKGTLSSCKQIILISMDLLGDIYVIDKAKYYSCRKTIENLKESKITEVRKLAKQHLIDFDNPTIVKNKLKFYTAYAFVIFFGGLLTSIFSTFLYDKIFISFTALFKTFLLTGFVMWLMHRLLTRDKLVKQSETFGIGLGFGFLGCFLLLYVNLKVTDSRQYKVNYEIIEHGTNLNKSRPTHPIEQPYVKIERNGKLEELSFFSSERELVENANYIELTLQTGIFGYDNIVAKKIKTTGANNLE